MWLPEGLENTPFIEMASNIIYIVALGVGFKCPCKIHLNTQWGGGSSPTTSLVPTALEKKNGIFAIFN